MRLVHILISGLPDSEHPFSPANLLNISSCWGPPKSFPEHFSFIPSTSRQFGNSHFFRKDFLLFWDKSYTRGQLWLCFEDTNPGLLLGQCELQPGSKLFSHFDLFWDKLHLYENEKMLWVSVNRLELFNPVELVCFRHWSNFPFALVFL